jgi:sulfate-transporting ATPase
VYALSSLGLVLIYRGSGVLNFAQGAIGGVGAYVYYDLHFNNGVPTALAVIVGVLVCALVGAVMHFLVMRPLSSAPPLTRVIATLGAMTVIQQALLILYGSQITIVPAFLPTETVSVFGNRVSQQQLILLGIAIVATVVLWAIYKFTRFGLATTAVSENEQTAQLSGHSPNRIALINWMAGCGLGGIAGILVVSISQLNGNNLVLMIVPILAVGLVGSFSSFPITLAAAVVIGIVQSEMARYVTTPGWAESVPFLAVMLILIVRGRPLPVRSHINERLPDIGSGIIKLRVAAPLIALTAVAILVLPSSWSNAMLASMVFATVCVSVIITTGYAGQLSLAQIAFAGFAGLVATRLAATQGWSFVPCALIGIAAAVPAGFIIGLPAVRTRGINLAIITFGLAFAMESVIFNTDTFTGGLNGTIIQPPTLFGWSVDPFAHPERYEFVALFVLVLALVVAANVRRGRAGRRLIAVRSNERAAASLGLGVPQAKLYAFAVSAGVAGAAGVIITFENSYVNYTSFDVFSGINTVIGTVLGGVGYLAGALIGGFGSASGLASRIVSTFTSSGNVADYVALALGVLLIVTLIANPDGIASVTARDFAARRQRRAERKSALRLAAPARSPANTAPASTAPASTAPASTGTAPAERVRRPQNPVRPAHLAIEGLTVRFGAVVAVDNVSLALEPGKVTGLMGPNGAGKTTLIDAVTGFVSAAGGTITLDGKPIGRRSAASRAGLGISRTFQSLELFEEISVADNIRVAIEAGQRGVYLQDIFWPRQTELTGAAEAAISVLGLDGDLDRRPGELPLGRRRLVSIARAIAAEPSVLMLDEPAAGLDEAESQELGLLIRGLADEWGLAILLVEHDVPLLMSTCDTVVAMDHGAYVTSGPPQEVRHHPKVVQSYMGEEPAEDTEPAGVPGSGRGTDPVESGQS